MVEVHAVTPLGADSTLDEHASVLRAYVDQQKAHEARLRDELSQVGDRIKRGEKAIAALQPAPVIEAAAEKPGKKDRRTPQQLASANWVPSEALIAKVLVGLEEHGGDENGITINRLAEATGVAGESVKRSLEVLRSRGQARFLGIRKFPTKNPDRDVSAKAYKPMPKTEEKSAFQLDDELSQASEAFVDSLSGGSDGSDD